MKTIAIITLGIAFSIAIFFLAPDTPKASVNSDSEYLRPTPTAEPPNSEVNAFGVGCSPQPSPLSEAQKNDPDRWDNVFGEREDSDCDGICDSSDNCPIAYNPNQMDKNADGYGDACDPKLVDKSFVDMRCDMDGDGVPDRKDTCPWVCNPDQKFKDVNENGVNDLCDNSLPNGLRGQNFCPKRIKVKAPKSPKPTTKR